MAQLKDDSASAYGAVIFLLRKEGKSWDWIAKKISLNERTARRYFAHHNATLKANPDLKQAIADARAGIPDLVKQSMKQFTRVLSGDYDTQSAQTQRIAADLAKEVLKSGNIQILTDPKSVVEHQFSNESDADLMREIDALTGSPDTSTEDESGGDSKGTEKA